MPIGHPPPPPPVHGGHGPGFSGHPSEATFPGAQPANSQYGLIGNLAHRFNRYVDQAAQHRIGFYVGLNRELDQARAPYRYGAAQADWPHPSGPVSGGYVPPSPPHGHGPPTGWGGHGEGMPPTHASAHGVPRGATMGASLDPALEQTIASIVERTVAPLLESILAMNQSLEPRLAALERRLSQDLATPPVDQHKDGGESTPLPRRPMDRRSPALSDVYAGPRNHSADWDRRSTTTDNRDGYDSEREDDHRSDAGTSSGRRRPPPPPPPRHRVEPPPNLAPGLTAGLDSGVRDTAAGDMSKTIIANAQAEARIEEDAREFVTRRLI